MTPGARLQAASEIIDIINSTQKPAHEVLKNWGASHRFAGSKDRKAIAERVYQVLRSQNRLKAQIKLSDGRSLILCALSLLDGLSFDEIAILFNGQGYGPSPLGDDEITWLLSNKNLDQVDNTKDLVSDYLVDKFKASFGDEWMLHLNALLQPRAPVDLRINGDRESIKHAMETMGYNVSYTPFSSLGLRISADPPPNIRTLPVFKNGQIEIQDEGSQILGIVTGAKPGETIIDFCAGAGGKTLLMLQMMRTQGRVIACDIDQSRLNNLKPRLSRASQMCELVKIDEDGNGIGDVLADRVLVDAPCSGSGVWRRRPENAEFVTDEEVKRLNQLQIKILTNAVKYVKIGGYLIYGTCSVFKDENSDVCDKFEERFDNFAAVSLNEQLDTEFLTQEGKDFIRKNICYNRLSLSPATSQTDGFFVALYKRMY